MNKPSIDPGLLSLLPAQGAPSYQGQSANPSKEQCYCDSNGLVLVVHKALLSACSRDNGAVISMG